MGKLKGRSAGQRAGGSSDGPAQGQGAGAPAGAGHSLPQILRGVRDGGDSSLRPRALQVCR